MGSSPTTLRKSAAKSDVLDSSTAVCVVCGGEVCRQQRETMRAGAAIHKQSTVALLRAENDVLNNKLLYHVRKATLKIDSMSTAKKHKEHETE